LLIALVLAAETTEPAWRSKVRALTETEAQQAVLDARAGAAYSATVVERNVICRFGTADECANASEEVDHALKRSPMPDTMAAIQEGNLCRAILYQLLEGLEIETRIEAILAKLRERPGFGKERLLVMEQRGELRKSHAVSQEPVTACAGMGGAFRKTFGAAGASSAPSSR
jgi:hypothetical protein